MKRMIALATTRAASFSTWTTTSPLPISESRKGLGLPHLRPTQSLFKTRSSMCSTSLKKPVAPSRTLSISSTTSRKSTEGSKMMMISMVKTTQEWRHYLQATNRISGVTWPAALPPRSVKKGTATPTTVPRRRRLTFHCFSRKHSNT